MKPRIQTMGLYLATAALSSAVVANSFAQAAAPSSALQSAVVLTKLNPLDYPPLARQIWITGDVNLLVGIRRDGSVASAGIVSGHPLLQQAALESAQHSEYQCRGCTEEVTSLALVFTFQLVPKHCPSPTTLSSDASEHEKTIYAQIDQSQNHVTIVDEGGICEGVYARNVRSAKYLYLWKCGLKIWRKNDCKYPRGFCNGRILRRAHFLS